MTEYIEREAALSAQNKSMNLAECRKRLERLPAADVAPVRHGKWEWHQDGTGYGIGTWCCSECNKIPPTWWSGIRTKLYAKPGNCYCPNCGARMGGDGE